MQEYQKHNQQQDLSAAIELLKNTAQLVRIATDIVTPTTQHNEQVKMIKDIDNYFTEWNCKSNHLGEIPTRECLYDLHCTLAGLTELIEHVNYPVITGNLNSDIVENHFSQSRLMTNDRNPPYAHYKAIQTSIMLTQTEKGSMRRGNTGRHFQPYAVTAGKALTKTKKSNVTTMMEKLNIEG